MAIIALSSPTFTEAGGSGQMKGPSNHWFGSIVVPSQPRSTRQNINITVKDLQYFGINFGATEVQDQIGTVNSNTVGIKILPLFLRRKMYLKLLAQRESAWRSSHG